MSTPTKPPAGPAAHYPSGILGSAHPGTVEDCPNLLCVQARETAGAPDSTLRGRIAAALRAAAKDCWDDCPLTEEECTQQHPIRVSATAHGVTSDIEAPVDALADALLPLFAAERAAGMRDGADWLAAEYTGPGTDVPIRRAADRLRARADATGEQT